MRRVTRLNAKGSAVSAPPMTDETPRRPWMTIATFALGAALFGFAGGWAWQASGVGQGATGEMVRNYILEHPELLPEAIDRLREKEMQAQIEPLRGVLEAPYAGAVLGNPAGAITLVEFSDYACPFCRASLADLEKLIAANPDLRVVIRETPILSEASADAARMALAAAEQGRFEAFHHAMFAKDRPDSASIAAAATEAGVDLAQARAAIATGKYDAELGQNAQLTEMIGLSGTPAWVIGNVALSGAVGEARLAEAIAAEREKVKAAPKS